MLAWKDILSRHSENLSGYQSNDCSPSTWFSSFTSLEGMKDFNSATTTGTGGVLLAYKGARTLDCRVEEEEEEEPGGLKLFFFLWKFLKRVLTWSKTLRKVSY